MRYARYVFLVLLCFLLIIFLMQDYRRRFSDDERQIPSQVPFQVSIPVPESMSGIQSVRLVGDFRSVHEFVVTGNMTRYYFFCEYPVKKYARILVRHDLTSLKENQEYDLKYCKVYRYEKVLSVDEARLIQEGMPSPVKKCFLNRCLKYRVSKYLIEIEYPFLGNEAVIRITSLELAEKKKAYDYIQREYIRELVMSELNFNLKSNIR